MIAAAVTATLFALYAGLGLITARADDFLPVGLVVVVAADALRRLIRYRRHKALDSLPNTYLAVTREVAEHDRPPGLLLHVPNDQPTHSGWYAYAVEHDEHSGDFVALSIKDLVDRWPQAARPLRDGKGKWAWNRARRAYRRIEPTGVPHRGA